MFKVSFPKIKAPKVKAPKAADVVSALSLYTFFPANVVFGFGDRLLKPKDDPNITGWKKLLRSNPISRMLTAFVIVFGVNQGVQQVSGLTFETAEEFLDKAGYSEEIVSEFADENIRVRPRSNFGVIHTAHDLPPLISLFSEVTNERIGKDALATRSTGLGALLNLNKWLKTVKPYLRDYLSEFVTLPREDATSAEIISQYGEVPLELLADLDIEDEKLRQAMTLYVLRLQDHEKEMGDFESKSAEAFVYAFKAVGEMHGDPAFAELALHVSALNFEEDPIGYYESLMVEAYLSGQPLPGKREAQNALWELIDLFPDDHNQFMDDMTSKLIVLQDILDNHRDQLSPLAIRRAELFIEAAEFFAPSLFPQDSKLEPDDVSYNHT